MLSDKASGTPGQGQWPPHLQLCRGRWGQGVPDPLLSKATPALTVEARSTLKFSPSVVASRKASRDPRL